MTSQSIHGPGAGAPPWQERQLGYGLKLVVLFGFALLTLVPLLVFRIGLGLIPALLLAFLLGKKKRSRMVPYANMSDLAVRGCCEIFNAPGDEPTKVALYVAQIDGGRLYCELAQRFPAALGGWVG